MAGLKQVSFTDPYSADELELQRRQALADALQKQSMTPMGGTQMAGPIAIQRSPLEGAAKLMQGYTAGRTTEDVNRRRQELVRQMQADAMKWYGNAPQGTPAQVQDTSQEGTGSMDMSGVQGPANVPAQPPTPDQQEQWLMSGMKNPYSSPIAQLKLAQLEKLNEPYTLAAGAQRRGPGGAVIADNPKPLPVVKPIVHDLPVGNDMVQPHISLDNGQTWKPVEGSQPIPKFAKSVGPTIVNPPAPTMSEVIDPKDPTRMLRVDAKTYKGGSLGDAGVLGVSGKEPTYAKREEKEGQGKDLLKSELDNLRVHFKTLLDAGAIPSDKAGALSNASAYIRSSGIGQVGGRMLGTQEQSARNEIQSSRLRLLNAIKNATGMSAQQLNSNAELKTWLDSLTNLQGSYESNIGIIDAVEKAFMSPKRRASDAVPDEPPPGAVKKRG